MIEDYFKSILDLLAPLPFVENPRIDFEKRPETVGFIRGEIGFRDGSVLHFRELVDLRHELRLVMYAYHYQDSEGGLVFRYDNTAHHIHVSTFPNHKHISDGSVISAEIVGLAAVLREIEASSFADIS